MKVISLLLLSATQAHKLEKHKSGWEKELIQISLSANEDLFSVVNDKMSRITNLVEIKKMEPSCDAACQKTCDSKADEMIRELKNPLHNITWNCKNNYDVYTTDYDPDHSHFDRISSDVMNVQRTLNRIEQLEQKIKQPGSWNWQSDETDTDKYVLRQLKKELGLPEDQAVGNIGSLNIREAVTNAVAKHADPSKSKEGFTKAYGLDLYNKH